MTKKAPMSSTERSRKEALKLKRFGIKKVYLRASKTQQVLMDLLIDINGCSSRDELLATLVEKEGRKHGLTLSQINKRLLSEENQ